MKVGGAVVNALAFTGSNFLFSQMKLDHSSDIQVEVKRHNRALEELTRAKDEWNKECTKYLDLVNLILKKETDATRTFHDVDNAMYKYFVVTGKQRDIPENLKAEN